ncbi:MAG: formylglycine-generating enzyme family protein [Victivallales bacterium]|nr:formylglycine-generating enzyme family protein [Victivallales bacterium]MBR0459333.1 formylglycine-generating enzyme family protein [Victivallales bacterium]
MKRQCLWAFALWMCMTAVVVAAEVSVSVEKVQQRWPWNGLVDIDYTVTYDDANADVYVGFIGKDGASNRSFPLKTLEGDGADGVVKAGTHRVTWDMSADEPNLHTGDFTVTIQAFTGAYPYMVVDLSGGVDVARYPVRYSATPPDVTQDTCRTTELWLRLIFPGTFMMGSPEEELGRNTDETLHQVTLTKPYYIGVFEVTQKQYQLVMGTNPSRYKGDTRPVEQVSYNTLRGSVNGASWPVSNQVDEDSFFYVLRAKTSLLFDLPTEAQWEYACRAGTTTALNSGKNLTATGECPNMAELGRYSYNTSDGKGGYSPHTKVGSYLPNAWGLYDMYGNVWEWCLDWLANYSSSTVTDPKGGTSRSSRMTRGGGIFHNAGNCRSAQRGGTGSGGSYNDTGFRVVCLPAVQ